VTTRLGLVATCSATYSEPYTLARQFASLDQISEGRAGWNLVTSNNEAEAFNHGRDQHLAHAERYDRAAEFADVVTGLWDSWDADAFIRDKPSGLYYDPAKMSQFGPSREILHRPRSVERSCSPQGRPVLVKAGASDAGRDLAARMAELVFTAQTTFEQAKQFYGDVMGRLPQYGRSSREIKIMPGLLSGGRTHRRRGA
jgi:N-acetyl-S-(2-succino)cysteine monooxygenase